MANKKIKNATPLESDGILFKSKQEKKAFDIFKASGLLPEYEKYTFNIFSGFYPTVECYDLHYDRKLKQRIWGLSKNKIQDITYTPDFVIMYHDIIFVVEIKGRENDVFPLKKKMFRKWMEEFYNTTGKRMIYFELYNKEQVYLCVDIIKSIMQEDDKKP